MKRSILGIFTVSVGAAIGLTGCGSKQEPNQVDSSTLPKAEVRVQTVENRPQTMTEDVVGTVRAKVRATLEARISGRIDKMPVTLGQKVQKGQLVARLSADEIGARLEQAEAALEEADRNWKRVAVLFEQQSVTRADYDAAQARQRAAKGAVAESRAMMGYVEILAPFDGVVTKKSAEVGDLAAPGKPLVDIEDPLALQLEADVPEAIASHISLDTKLAVQVDAADALFEGAVSEIAPAADSASHTVRVKLDIAPRLGLMPGQFGRVAVPFGETKSVRVPVGALVQRGQLELIFSMTDQHARMLLVKTGRRVRDEIEILSGLEAGAIIVVKGAEQLTDGQSLEPK